MNKLNFTLLGVIICAFVGIYLLHALFLAYPSLMAPTLIGVLLTDIIFSGWVVFKVRAGLRKIRDFSEEL